jgi:peptidoglycan-associated lipoprotein
MNTMLKNLVLLGLVVACSKNSKNTSNNEAYGSDKNVSSDKRHVQSLSKDYFVADRVFFDFDSSEINSEGLESVKTQSTFLKNEKSAKSIIVEGHADERGTAEYNLSLGKRRADSLASALKKHGFKGSVKVVSYGKERPVETAATSEESHASNRRAVIVLG